MISIIGSGRVGSAIAFLAAATAIDNIQLVNRHKEKAIGQVLDISNAIPKESPFSVISTDFSQIKNSDVIVISASTAIYTSSRTEMLSEQVTMIKEIAKNVQKFSPDSKILMVSNPVDILSYVFLKETGIQREHVIGVASSLDSSRFRYLLSKELNVKASEIQDAMVLGEHGDSMVPIFSIAKHNKIPVLELLNSSQVEKITRDLRDYWKVLRNFKGPSIYGIAKNTVDVINAIIKNKTLSAPASVMLNGEYNLSDVCLGIPIQINRKGMENIQEINLEKTEQDSLIHSATVIKNYLTKQIPNFS